MNEPERLLSGRAPGRVSWAISPGLTGYQDAVDIMAARAVAIADGEAPELVWLLEHPPLYTAGTSTKPADLIMPDLFPVHKTGRGGELTYHGPGQRVAYVMLDLKRRQGDVRAFVHSLERWIVAALSRFGLAGMTRDGRVGVWVSGDGRHEAKIAALGIRVRRSVSFHGISVNVDPDLSHYRGIVPCGITNHGVTSLRALGIMATMAEVDAALHDAFAAEFGADLAIEQPPREPYSLALARAVPGERETP